MSDRETSSQWTKTQVLKHLREKAQTGEPVKAQVFLNEDAGDVSAVVKTIEKAAKTPLQVGKIHKLAKSFSVTADPEALAAIADMPNVKSVLPAEIDDIYPKPLNVKRD